jgi:hypothetical protein
MRIQASMRIQGSASYFSACRWNSAAIRTSSSVGKGIAPGRVDHPAEGAPGLRAHPQFHALVQGAVDQGGGVVDVDFHLVDVERVGENGLQGADLGRA